MNNVTHEVKICDFGSAKMLVGFISSKCVLRFFRFIENINSDQ